MSNFEDNKLELIRTNERVIKGTNYYIPTSKVMFFIPDHVLNEHVITNQLQPNSYYEKSSFDDYKEPVPVVEEYYENKNNQLGGSQINSFISGLCLGSAAVGIFFFIFHFKDIKNCLKGNSNTVSNTRIANNRSLNAKSKRNCKTVEKNYSESDIILKGWAFIPENEHH